MVRRADGTVVLANRRNIEAQAKIRRAVELRRAGFDWAEVAKRAGYRTAAAANTAVYRYMAAQRKGTERSLAEMRADELDRLDRLMASVWAVAIGEDIEKPDPKSKAKHPTADTLSVALRTVEPGDVAEWFEEQAHGGSLRRAYGAEYLSRDQAIRHVRHIIAQRSRLLGLNVNERTAADAMARAAQAMDRDAAAQLVSVVLALADRLGFTAEQRIAIPQAIVAELEDRLLVMPGELEAL